MSLTRLARRKSFQCLSPVDAGAGGCFTPNGRGHNYELEAYFEGQVDPVTGMIANLRDIDALLTGVIQPLDGKNLNLEVSEFKSHAPTTETIAGYLARKIIELKSFKDVKLVKVRLYEYEDLWVDVWP